MRVDRPSRAWTLLEIELLFDRFDKSFTDFIATVVGKDCRFAIQRDSVVAASRTVGPELCPLLPKPPPKLAVFHRPPLLLGQNNNTT